MRFFLSEAENLKYFVIIRGNFPNLDPNQRWLPDPRPTKNWPGPITSIFVLPIIMQELYQILHRPYCRILHWKTSNWNNAVDKFPICLYDELSKTAYHECRRPNLDFFSLMDLKSSTESKESRTCIKDVWEVWLWLLFCDNRWSIQNQSKKVTKLLFYIVSENSVQSAKLTPNHDAIDDDVVLSRQLTSWLMVFPLSGASLQ